MKESNVNPKQLASSSSELTLFFFEQELHGRECLTCANHLGFKRNILQILFKNTLH